MKRLTFAGTSKLVASGALAVVLLASTTACSSSDSSGSKSSASSGTGGEFAAKVAEYKKGVPATFGGPTEKAPAKAGVKLAVIPCSAALTGCQVAMDGADEAGKAAGWDVRHFDGKGTPRGWNEAILQAVSWGANVIVTESIDGNLVQQGMKAAHDAGIVLVSTANATGSPDPEVKTAPGKIGYDVDVSASDGAIGIYEAHWIINDSGQKANTVIISDDEFRSVSVAQAEFRKAYAECGKCKLSGTIPITADQVGPQVAQLVTSYLQTHPAVDYIVAPYDPVASAIVPAIAQAGLADKVKVVSASGNPENLELIKKGRVQSADVAIDLTYLGWAAVDQAIRKQAGMPFSEPNGENTPMVLIDKGNLPADTKQLYAAAFDYKTAFKALWAK